jgi:hypothetical protein
MFALAVAGICVFRTVSSLLTADLYPKGKKAVPQHICGGVGGEYV